MTCASCGATIADKAIVCYRCGAPTATPARQSQTPARRSPMTVLIAMLVVGAALLGFALIEPAGSGARLGSATAAVVLLLGAVILWIRAGGRRARGIDRSGSSRSRPS